MRGRYSQQTLFTSPREYNYETRQQEHVIGSAWSTPGGADSATPMEYSTRNDPAPAASPEIGSMSSSTKRLPTGSTPVKRQKTGYGEGAGFPKNSQNGYQQGHLFANTAPARDANKRNHVAYATRWGDLNGASDVRDDHGSAMDAYDPRIAKGSLTGHFDPNAPMFHGTKKKLQGDSIVPGKYKAIDQIGHKKGLTDGGRRLNAYATTDRSIAEGYTKTAKGTSGKTAKAYQVRPTGPVSADLEYLSDHDPLRTQNSIVTGDYHAVKSPRPLKVVNEVQFGGGA